MEKKYFIKDDWDNTLFEINTTENMIVNAYHFKKKYCAEFVFNDTKIKLYKDRRYELERLLGEMGIELINYHSSNGSIIKKTLIKTKSAYDFKEYEYKYVKYKED